LIRQGKLKLNDVLDENSIKIISKKIGDSTSLSLSEMKEKVGTNVSWEELKCFRAQFLPVP
ncbi:MAG: hypothetical protein KJ941_00835, partial [Bacteroidetes bacterium]|nr:hypothetical protein [Bacteroidota bacterium]